MAKAIVVDAQLIQRLSPDNQLGFRFSIWVAGSRSAVRSEKLYVSRRAALKAGKSFLTNLQRGERVKQVSEA